VHIGKAIFYIFEGHLKDLEGIMKYASLDKQDYSPVSESAYW